MGEVRRQRLDERAARLGQRLVDLVDRLDPRPLVAGEDPLGQQVVARHRSWRVRPAGGGAEAGSGGLRRQVGVPEVGGDRTDHDRALAEEVDDRSRGLLRVGHAAEDHHQPVALHGAEGIHARGPRGAPYGVDDAGLGVLGRYGAEHHGHVAARAPADGAGAGEDGVVGLVAQHGVDDQRLQPRVPGAADLGRARIDLGGRERGLPARSAGRRRARRWASSGSRMSSRFCSTTSMLSRIRSTVWCSGDRCRPAPAARPRRGSPRGAWPKAR